MNLVTIGAYGTTEQHVHTCTSRRSSTVLSSTTGCSSTTLCRKTGAAATAATPLCRAVRQQHQAPAAPCSLRSLVVQQHLAQQHQRTQQPRAAPALQHPIVNSSSGDSSTTWISTPRSSTLQTQPHASHGASAVPRAAASAHLAAPGSPGAARQLAATQRPPPPQREDGQGAQSRQILGVF